MTFAWLWSLFIYSFITYILFCLLKKNCGKKQNSNAAHQPHSPCLCSTRLLIEIQSSELYNMRTLRGNTTLEISKNRFFFA